MEEVKEPALAGLEEPFFGDNGNVIRIQRAPVKPRLSGAYFFVWPFIGSILTIIAVAVKIPDQLGMALFITLVINGWFAMRYMDRNTQPGLGFEMTKDSARLYHLGDEEELVTLVPFVNATVVDVDLNEATSSEEYGHLFGWTFENHDVKITVSANDDWDIWTIQALRDPVYKVIKTHGMEKGPGLRFYKEGLKDVVPIRSRGMSEPPPEPPNHLNTF